MAAESPSPSSRARTLTDSGLSMMQKFSGSATLSVSSSAWLRGGWAGAGSRCSLCLAAAAVGGGGGRLRHHSHWLHRLVRLAAALCCCRCGAAPPLQPQRVERQG